MYGSFNIRQMYDSKEFTKNEIVSLLQSFKKTVIYEAFFATGPDNSMSMTTNPKLFEKLKKRPELLAHMRGWNDALLVQLIKKARDSFFKFAGSNLDSFKYISDLVSMFDEMFVLASTPQKTDSEYIKMLELFAMYDEPRLSSPEYLELYGDQKAKMEILMARNVKIIKSILVAHGLQMVIADFALVALLVSQPGQVEYVLEPSAIHFNDQSLTVAIPDPASTIHIVRNVDRPQLFECIQEWA